MSRSSVQIRKEAQAAGPRRKSGACSLGVMRRCRRVTEKQGPAQFGAYSAALGDLRGPPSVLGLYAASKPMRIPQFHPAHLLFTLSLVPTAALAQPCAGSIDLGADVIL